MIFFIGHKSKGPILSKNVSCISYAASHGLSEWLCREHASEGLCVWVLVACLLCLPMTCDEWDLQECIPTEPRAWSLGPERLQPLGWHQHGWAHSVGRDMGLWRRNHLSISGPGCARWGWKLSGIQAARILGAGVGGTHPLAIGGYSSWHWKPTFWKVAYSFLFAFSIRIPLSFLQL